MIDENDFQLVDNEQDVHEAYNQLEESKLLCEEDLNTFNDDSYKVVRYHSKLCTIQEQRAIEYDINEATTSADIIRPFIEEIIGDNIVLSIEHAIRKAPSDKGSKRADIVLKTDGKISAIIECKRVRNKLGTPEVKQIQAYMVREKVPIGILTNGFKMRVFYHTMEQVFYYSKMKNLKYFKEFINFLNIGDTRNLIKI